MNFRICHIGCGSMSEIGHGPALKKYCNEYSNTELAACCDIDVSKAEKFCLEYGFSKCYTDWKEMLDKEVPDAVSLVVPVSLTSQMAVEILGMEYNLLTEKPPGMTWEECSNIINAANAANKYLGVMFNRRYMPMVKTLKEMLNERTIEYLRYDFYRTGRKDKDFSTTAIHGVDTAMMLADDLFLDVQIDIQPLKTTPVGNILVSCETRSGTRVEMNFYPDSGMNAERVIIISEGSTYFLNIPIWDCPDYPGSIRVFNEGKLQSELIGERTEMFINSGFYDEHRDFYESIKNDLPSPADMTQHLRSVEIMEAIRKKSAISPKDD